MAGYAYRLPRRYRYRGRGDRGKVIGLALGVALAIAAAGAKTPSARHAIAAAGLPLAGGSALATPAGWDRALLAALGDPQTSCNISAVAAWEHAEGGGFGNQASFNPLNVNPGPGAGWPGYNATGAWAFPDAATGLRYTVATLRNGYYGGVLAALSAGRSAQAVCDAIMASPWAATKYYGTLTATC